MYETLTLNHCFRNNIYDVIGNEYDILRDLISAECDIPENLFSNPGENKTDCYFLFANETCRFLFIDSR
jgi:hypothetical protein